MAKEKTISPIGRILDIIGTLLIIAAIVLCLMLAVPRLLGIQSYTVLTGSMEPSIPVGSLIYAKYTEPQTLAEGDVIVFNDSNASIPVTHRVVENDTQTGQIITKGDANAQEDFAPISYYDVLGKVLLHIPVLGRFLAPLGTLTGKIGMLAIIAAGLLLSALGRKI